jgi:hypothetical protein
VGKNTKNAAVGNRAIAISTGSMMTVELLLSREQFKAKNLEEFVTNEKTS